MVLVDSKNGEIHLPCGLVISPELTSSQLQQLSFPKQAHHCNTPPWHSFRLSGGNIDGYPLGTWIWFYGELLVSVDMWVDLEPDLVHTWDNYSVESDARMKTFHDNLLLKELGEPHSTIRIDPGSTSVLEMSVGYRYKWGGVASFHDERSGGTHITIGYGDRHEFASADYHYRRTQGPMLSRTRLNEFLRRLIE